MESKDWWILVLAVLVVVGIVYIIFFTGCEDNPDLGPAPLSEFEKFSVGVADGTLERRYVHCDRKVYSVGDGCTAACEPHNGNFFCMESSSCNPDTDCSEVVAV